jgi:nucleotide-binding universal stress UspA family protein
VPGKLNLNNFTEKRERMRKMLFPTDFSENAKNAFAYAASLAKSLDISTIKVVHVLLPEATGSFDYIPPITAILENRGKMLNEFVKTVQASQALEGLQIEQEVLVGFPADEINRVSDDVDCIVMGTTGNSTILEKVFGSVSSTVAQRAECPVFLIPPHIKAFQQPEHIVFAVGSQAISETPVKKLKMFNDKWGAQIHFVHVQERNDGSYEQTKARLNKLLQENYGHFTFEIIEQDEEGVSEGIAQYADKLNSRLVIFASKHRSFWDGIFHRSQTKKMVLGTRLPVLVFHEE